MEADNSVTKWMLSKGQGRTMGRHFTLLNALAHDDRIEEAEELWAKVFSENLEALPRIFFNKMISIYYSRAMHDKMFKVFVKAMAETGQIKLYGDHPTLTEISLYRVRRHLFKEERLQSEQKRLEEIGPLAYYSEWVEGWKRDTSREAVQKHFEETGEDENTQLLNMFQHQTASEYPIMMGRDVRIRRDPLAM